jgi:hypothetical protein
MHHSEEEKVSSSMKNGDKGKEQEQLNTMVFDPRKGYGLEHVDNPVGHQRRFGKKSVFVMKRVYAGVDDDAGTLEPVNLPPKMGISPKKLFRALHWEKETAILFALQNPLLEKLKVAGMYALIGILILTLYLIFSSM